MKPNPSNILNLVERQIRTWTLNQQAAKAPQPEPQVWPVIGVSREFGALGAAIAEAAAKRLGFSFWHNELVHAIAEEAGINEKILATLDEHLRSAIEDAIEGALLGSAYQNSEYLEALMKVVHAISTHGRAVVVGRGVQYILPPRSVLRVRVVAPLDHRVKGFAKRQGITERAARKEIARMDKERATFMRHHFKRDIADPEDYDLVVNSAVFELERAVDVVLAAYEAKFGVKIGG